VGRSVYYFTDAQQFGGAEQALLMLIEGIDHRAWQPTLLYNPTPAAGLLAERARGLGASVQAVPPMPLGLEGAREVPAFARELRRAKPAVFHAHLSWPLAAKYALFAAVLARVPAIVATVHLYPEFPLDRSNYLQERLLAAFVGRYIAVSNDIATRLTGTFRWPPSKIEVIHNGISLDRFRRGADADLRAQLAGPGERPVFLTVARLDAQKGHDVLLRAAAQVAEARFALAGEGPERSRLESEAKRLGLGDRVLFLGQRPDVPELLAASDGFVLPSLYEGSPLAVLEAMAAAKPVISSAIGGTDELVVDGESGLLVPPGDANALTGAIRRVLSSPQLRGQLGAAARSRVERHFSASVTAKRVARVYEDLLRGAR
jgi:glycosyltransferase involved in cell wall biosynthesis